jgi:hypothetical protein
MLVPDIAARDGTNVRGFCTFLKSFQRRNLIGINGYHEGSPSSEVYLAR